MDDEQQSRKPTKRPRPSGGRRAEKPARAHEPRIEPAADPRRSRSLEYGAAILECYTPQRLALGIAELAELVKISRSTTHRYAVTLVALGYLEQDDKRKYRLASRAADPGRAALGTLRAGVKAHAVLEELREQVGHTVSLAVLSGTRAIYVHRLLAHRRGQHEIDQPLGSGGSVPLHCTAIGKALLAGVPAAERAELIPQLELTGGGPNAIASRDELELALQGIGPGELVLSDEEQLAGARALAVLLPPIPGLPALAIEVSVPAAAYSQSRLLRELGPPLRRAAKLICGD